MLEMEEQTPLDVSDTHAKGKISDEDFNVFQNDLMSCARVLPQGISMNEEQFLAFHESKTGKLYLNLVKTVLSV